MKFLRNFLASLTALIVFSVIGFMIFLGVIAVMSSAGEVVVKEHTILHLKLNEPLVEIEGEDDPLAELPIFGTGQSNIGVVQLKKAIAHAAEDDKIEGIYLDVPYLMAGYGNVEEIRNALLSFKESGKFIVAYADFYTEGSYYLASVADKIYLNPSGDLEFNGLSINTTFFKGTFDKLGIKPQIFRVGDFKSAVEPFIREDMSEANRLQLSAVLESLNGNLLRNVAESRSIDVEELTEISNQMKIRKAEDALTLNLIDGVYYYDEVISELMARVNVDKEQNLTFISYGNYKNTVSNYQKSSNEVAVIVATGEIVRGEGVQNKSIGGKKFANGIRKARLNDKVKAIVLRINSPGGDFVASDMMWREIKLAAQVKPVIASMSDYAASGGYYMAMACDTIVAQPTTITGSIGIFGMLFNVEGFLKEKLGVTHDVVKTGQYSDIMTITRPLSEGEKAIIQQGTNEGYETFTSKAAEGRSMAKEELLKIASGRVWTGEQALENGLVDMLGGLEDAIEIAVNKANISDDYKLRYYPKYEPLIERLFNKGADVKAQMVEEELGDMYIYLKEIEKLKNYQGIQARMPYDISLQ
jgi:protease-4